MVKIKFNEEKHEYTIDDKKCKSVTTLIGELFKPFNSKRMAKILSTPDKTAQDFLNEWREAANHGTRVHKALENHILKKPTELKIERDTLKTAQGIKALHKIFKTLGEPICYPELIIGNKKLGIAGTIDLMIEHNHPDNNKTDRVATLIDWKTNKKISEIAYGKGIHETTKHLNDSSVVKYGLQMSMYAFILETFYGTKIDKLYLIHLFEDGYNIIDMKYMKDDVKKILKVK